MSRVIKIGGIEEGEFFCKWMHNRLIKQNKNVIGAELGPTGSGKSYRDLRKAELWYAYHFKKPFPKENICFGVHQALKRITSGDLKSGEVLIFEEAGVNLGNLDFQSKISKMFTYILQSFRSMNIALFMNLPYLSMLNKSARLLTHYSSISVGIDFETNTNKCKLLMHQVSQRTGKIYYKYPRVKHNGRWKKLKKISYKQPSKELIDHYESQKANYLSKISKEYMELTKEADKDKVERNNLTPAQLEVYNLNQEGLNQTQIGEHTGKSQVAVSKMLCTIRKRGYEV